MFGRKTIWLAVSVVGLFAVAAAMTVKAQDGQQSSRRTHQDGGDVAGADRSSSSAGATTSPPTTGAPTGVPTQAAPGSATGQPATGQPTPAADPFAHTSRRPDVGTQQSTGGQTQDSTTPRSYDPFAGRTGSAVEPRPFDGTGGSQLPPNASSNSATQIPGAITPDEGTSALRPTPTEQTGNGSPFTTGNSLRGGTQGSANSGSTTDPFASNPMRNDSSVSPPTRAGDVMSQGSTVPPGVTSSPGMAADAPVRQWSVGQGAPGQDAPPISNDIFSQRTDSPLERLAARTMPRGAAITGAATLFRQQAPSLVIETKGPEQIIVGREAILRVQLFNEGDLPATDISIMIDVPSGADVLGTEPTGGHMESTAATPNGLKWRIESINPGGGESLTLRVLPQSADSLDLRMRWTAAATEAVAQMRVLEPKLQLTLTGPEEIPYGEKAIYTLSFANPGTADAEDVEVLLAPLEPGEEAETHEIGTIAAGDKRDVEIELIPHQTGSIKIRAEASALGGLVSQAAQDVLIRRAGIDVQLEGPNFRYAKTPATYRVKIINTGNAAATGVQVGAVLPPGSEFLSASHDGQAEQDDRVRWRMDQLAAGAEVILEFRCQLAQVGQNRIEAMAIADGGLRGGQETATDVEALADLNLNVRDPQGPVPVGEQTEYEIVISNRGTKAAERIEVMAFFSEGIEPTSVTGAAHQIHPGTVVIGPLPVLAADDQMVIKITAKADQPGNHQFRVQLKCVALDTELAEQKMTRFYGDGPEEVSQSRGAGVSQPVTSGGGFRPMPATDAGQSGAGQSSTSSQGAGTLDSATQSGNRYETDSAQGDRYSDRFGTSHADDSAGDDSTSDAAAGGDSAAGGDFRGYQPTPANGG